MIDAANRAVLRRALLTGAATGVALAGAAHAQVAPTVSQDVQGNIVYNADTLTGGASVLRLRSRAGTIAADVKTIVSTNAATTPDRTIVDLETNGAGGIAGTFGSITATGSGYAQGVEADTNTGNVTLKTGTVDLSGSYTRGLYVESNTGNVSITADQTFSRGTGIRGDSSPGEAIVAFTGGAIAVTSNNAEANGQYASAIVAIGDAGVTVNSTRAVSTGELGSTLSLRTTTGPLTVISGSVTNTGRAGNAIGASSTTGTIAVSSGTIATTGAGASGINASASNGAVTVTSDKLTGSGLNATGINARGTVVAITSGEIATSRNAIVATGLGSAGSATVRTTGATTVATGAAIQATGTTASVQTAGETRSAAGVGISVSGTRVAVSTGENSVTSGGSSGISVFGQTVSITNGGTVAATSGATYGIYASGAGTGGIDITSKALTIAGSGASGTYATGIFATSSGTAPITVASGTVTGGSTATAGIEVLAGASPVSITSGTVTMSGVSAYGIHAQTTTGAISIDAGRTATTATGFDEVLGQSNEPIYALSTVGSITIRSQDASSAGLYAGAVTAFTGTTNSPGGNVSITSGLATTSGDLGAAVYGQSRGGSVAIASDKVVTSGTGTTAISGQSTTRETSIVSNTVSATGQGAFGIQAVGSTLAGVTARDVAAVADAITIRAQLGEARALLTGTIASSTGTALQARGTRVAVDVAAAAKLSGVTGVDVTAAGANTITNAGAIAGTRTGVTFDGGVLGNTGSVTGGTIGVAAVGNAARITNSGTITGGVSAAAGLTLVNSGTVTATAAPAIQADGPVSIVNSGTLASTGGVAVRLGAGNDVVELRTGSVVTGTILTGGGNDVLNLVGTSATATPTQRLAVFDEVERVNVASGYWTADTGVSFAGLVNIQNGATLRYTETSVGGQPTLPVYSAAINVDGRLVVDARSIGTAGNLRGIPVSGSGGIDFVGTGQFVADSNALSYTGPTTVSNGTVVLLGNLPGALTINAGGTVKLGAGTATGTLGGSVLNNGVFVYDRSDSYTIASAFGGTGVLVKNGAGTLTFGGTYGFTGTTTVNGGDVRIAGAIDPATSLDLQSGRFDVSAARAPAIAALAGTGGASLLIGTNTLSINQVTNTSYAGTIVGSGVLVKTGAGRLNLTGTSGFTGTTTVSGGILSVNGSLAGSPLTVARGGTLGGTGTVGSTTVESGGIFSPGNSIGTIRVAGNLTFAAGSIYQVEANAAGQSDLIVASGTATIGGGTVQVLADTATRYRGRTGYTILTAAGGVTGTFTNATSNLAFLTPALGYTANSVTLALTRNNVAFAAVGQTPNQRALGGAVQALGAGNALFEEALFLSDTGAGLGFGSLSGEYYADVDATLIADTQPVRQALLLQPNGGEGLRAWGAGLGSKSSAGTSSSDVKALRGMIGGIAGLGYATSGFDIGLGGGGGRSDVNVLGLASSGGVETTYLAGYAGYRFGALALRTGGTYAWNEVHGQRQAQVGTVGGIVRGRYDARVWQVFGEAAYGLSTGPMTIEPFAGVSHVRQKSDAFVEGGGATALAVDGKMREVTFGTLGARAAGAIGIGDGIALAPRASVAWRHGWGDLDTRRSARFAGTTSGFVLEGTALPKDVADITAGIDIDKGPARLSLGYIGTFGKDWHDNGVQANVTIRF